MEKKDIDLVLVTDEDEDWEDEPVAGEKEKRAVGGKRAKSGSRRLKHKRAYLDDEARESKNIKDHGEKDPDDGVDIWSAEEQSDEDSDEWTRQDLRFFDDKDVSSLEATFNDGDVFVDGEGEGRETDVATRSRTTAAKAIAEAEAWAKAEAEVADSAKIAARSPAQKPP